MKGREVLLEGRTPRGLHGSGRRPSAAKGGRMDKLHSNHRHTTRQSKGRQGPGQRVEYNNVIKHRDEQWNPAGVGNIQVERCYATWLVGGENQAQHIEVEWLQPVICGGTVGLRSGGRNKDPEHGWNRCGGGNQELVTDNDVDQFQRVPCTRL